MTTASIVIKLLLGKLHPDVYSSRLKIKTFLKYLTIYVNDVTFMQMRQSHVESVETH